jgi:hypothetical protein
VRLAKIFEKKENKN